MKKCGKCHKLKDELEFNKKNSRLEKLQPYCRECEKIRKKEYYSNNISKFREYRDINTTRNRKFLQRYKRTLKCVNCGESDTRCLDFHHVKTKKFNIASLIASSYSLQTLKIEIRKCIILCANCHRKLHYKNYRGK
jgi:hypothetical protein